MKSPKIVIDGVFFQLYQTGIARVWKSYLDQWAGSDFAGHLAILDRNRTAPRIAGATYHDVPPFDERACGKEMLQIEAWCQELGADVFISTYYSTPIRTRSVMMVHDMIPELQSNGKKESWHQEEKALAILHASRFIAVSQNTARDLRRFYPHVSEQDVAVIPCAVDPLFAPAEAAKVAAMKSRFALAKPYFLVVGTRKGFQGYKNVAFLFQTLEEMKGSREFEVICVAGEPTLEELGGYRNVSARRLAHVPEEELVALYSGAEALVYPSLYEGFGLPVIEAMACGCPVITCPNGSIPEVAGDAALFVNNDDRTGLAAALRKVGDPHVRAELRARGFARARTFSWKKSAEELREALLSAAALPEISVREALLRREFREKEQRVSPLIELGRDVPRRGVKLKLGRYHFHLGISRH